LDEKKGQPLGFRWTWAVRDDGPKEWNSTVRAVLFCLGTYLDNQTGRAVVSQATVAKGANVHRHTVRRVLQTVEQDGWLRSWKHKGEGQRWATTVYQVAIPPIVKVVHPDGTTSEERLSHPGPKVVTSGPEGCTPRPYKNSVNSENSGDSAPDGAGSPDGSPSISLIEEEGVDIESHHRELLDRLSEEERLEVRTAVTGGTDFPPERLTAGMLATLPEDTLAGLWARVRAREAEEQAA
jgi:DNA-binding IscR family transcriptional regulator